MIPGGEVVGPVLNTFPGELASKLVLWIQAIGGAFILYLVILIIRTYFVWKMKRDIEQIKGKLGISSKKCIKNR